MLKYLFYHSVNDIVNFHLTKEIANLEFIKDGKTATISYSQKTDIITGKQS